MVRGLVGPREAGRLWGRHLLNSAVVQELLPQGARLADVGSGAGLPGIPLALARPDLDLTLVEPSQRRCAFLREALERLDLHTVRVVRGRAPEVAAELPDLDVVVARALAPLDQLVAWCLPLLPPGGRLLSLRGARAEAEVQAAAAAVRAAGGRQVAVLRCGTGLLADPTTVVSMTRVRLAPPRSEGRSRGQGRVPGR